MTVNEPSRENILKFRKCSGQYFPFQKEKKITILQVISSITVCQTIKDTPYILKMLVKQYNLQKCHGKCKYRCFPNYLHQAKSGVTSAIHVFSIQLYILSYASLQNNIIMMFCLISSLHLIQQSSIYCNKMIDKTYSLCVYGHVFYITT